MSNGLSYELDSAWKRLRNYASIFFIVSLFFLGFSIISLYIVRGRLAIYGIICFGASTLTAGSLFFDKFSHMGKVGLCNVLLANALDVMYFGASTMDLHKSGYSVGYVFFSALLLLYFILNTLVGCYLLYSVQRFTSEDHEMEANE